MAEFSRAALRDLRDIFAWSEDRFGRAQAERYLLMLRSRIAALHAQPTLGRRYDDAAPGVRRVASGSHFIYYRERPWGIMILRVLHQRMLQDLGPNFRSEISVDDQHPSPGRANMRHRSITYVA